MAHNPFGKTFSPKIITLQFITATKLQLGSSNKNLWLALPPQCEEHQEGWETLSYKTTVRMDNNDGVWLVIFQRAFLLGLPSNPCPGSFILPSLPTIHTVFYLLMGKDCFRSWRPKLVLQWTRVFTLWGLFSPLTKSPGFINFIPLWVVLSFLISHELSHTGGNF